MKWLAKALKASPAGRRMTVHKWREERVTNQIMACNACALGSSNRVPFDGPTWNPDLVLLGEAPGANEDRAGKPFVGRAGKLLDEMLVRADTSRKRCVITNSACCRPPSNRDPEWSELTDCEPNRLAQINLARTPVGVSMGRIALSVLKGDPSVPIGKYRSKPFWAYGKVWVPTYHPAYALRQGHAKSQIIGDLVLAMKLLKGDEPFPVDMNWPEWELVDGAVVVRDEASVIPEKILELAEEIVYTREEWIKMQYSPSLVFDVVNEFKKTVGATVVR